MQHKSLELDVDPQNWTRYWLPYHFEPMVHPRYKHVYLPLNRQYKPIGVLPSFPHVNYEDYEVQYVRFHSDPHKYVDVWVKDSPGLFLYTDGRKTRGTYFERLARLCTHKMTLINFPKKHAFYDQ